MAKEKNEDVAPELLEQVQAAFNDGLKKNERVKTVKQRYKNGTITYADVEVYATELGQILSQAYARVITKDVLPNGKMYWNIAERVVGTTLQHNFDLVEKLALAVIKKNNEAAGLGISAVSADR